MKKLLHIAAAILLALPAAKAQTFSGSLTTASPLTAATDGGSLSYYFEAYAFEVTTPGTYMFLASSDFDSYGQLYVNDSFYFGYPNYNAILFQDDSIDVDFGFQYNFAPGKYTLVVSTFNGLETGSYSVTATGPAPLTFTSATLVAGAPPEPLPLTLLNFSAQKQGNNSAVLQWTTVTETNVSHFEVEKSNDGKNYSSIGRIAAAGNDQTGKQTYTFTDAALSLGVNTYRLKMTDKDGTFTYSHIAALSWETQQTEAALYPNPSSGLTMLRMKAAAAGTMQVTVADLSGRKVLSQQYKVEVGRNEHPLDIGSLAPGAYLLQWGRGAETGTLRLIRE